LTDGDAGADTQKYSSEEDRIFTAASKNATKRIDNNIPLKKMEFSQLHHTKQLNNTNR
jgi:hypothetical protein